MHGPMSTCSSASLEAVLNVGCLSGTNLLWVFLQLLAIVAEVLVGLSPKFEHKKSSCHFTFLNFQIHSFQQYWLVTA
jgi:hypothetical protein